MQSAPTEPGHAGGDCRIVIVPEASHPFGKPGALDTVLRLARSRFAAHPRAARAPIGLGPDVR